MRNASVRVCALSVTFLMLALAVLAPAAGARRISAFGDTGTTTETRQNVAMSIDDGATLYLGLGDYRYDTSLSTWKSIFSPFDSRGIWLVKGDHDTVSEYTWRFPGGATHWVKDVDGARVVGIDSTRRLDLGTSEYTYARDRLCGAAASMRVLVLHKAWWLLEGARHPGSEFFGAPSAMDALVRECGVDVVLAADEHNYQRLLRNDATYLIVGSGGRSLYPVRGAPSGTVASCSCYGHVILDVTGTRVDGVFRRTDGTVIDRFSETSSTDGGETFSATFSDVRGNAWWVETEVSVAGGTLAGVDARVDGGSWIALTATSWGSWARSIRAPEGSTVEFRARSTGGASVTSQAYAWPP